VIPGLTGKLLCPVPGSVTKYRNYFDRALCGTHAGFAGLRGKVSRECPTGGRTRAEVARFGIIIAAKRELKE